MKCHTDDHSRGGASAQPHFTRPLRVPHFSNFSRACPLGTTIVMRHGMYIQDFEIQNFHQVLSSLHPHSLLSVLLVGPGLYLCLMGWFLCLRSLCGSLDLVVLCSHCACLLYALGHCLAFWIYCLVLVHWFPCLVDGSNATCNWFSTVVDPL